MVADGVPPIRIPMGQGLVGASIRDDEVLLINDVANEDSSVGVVWTTVAATTPSRSSVCRCVPKARVIGALQLLNKPSGFTETDAGLLGLLAQFAASAIDGERLRQEAESARMVKLEVALARDVQERLLPECPRNVDGIDCIGFCRPAHSIGGDYYDLLPLTDGSFAFTLGDVAGKGVPAAVMMASIQTLLRSLLTRNLEALAEAIASLNQTLFISSTAERYSTLFCGVISRDRRTLTYVNAGHVPPLLLHADGQLDRLKGGGFPVAMVPNATYMHFEVPLAAGDRVIVVSDGIVEALNSDGEFWDEEEVDRVILANRDIPLSRLPSLLADAVDRFAAGAEQYDDMTVVALDIG